MIKLVKKAIILAAGRGKRLMPLTADRPKPMVEISGKPLLEWIIREFAAVGITETIIIYGYLGDVIKDYFGDGSEFGMKMTYIEQTVLNGTAGAMLLAEQNCCDEPVLLHWGDIMTAPENLIAVFNKANNHPADADCVLSINWVDDPWAGGAVYREGDRVTKLVEKPQPGTAGTNWNIGGVIVYSEKIWNYLHKMNISGEKERYVTEAMDMMIKDGLPVVSHELIGERVHFTTPEDVKELANDPRLREWVKI